GRPLSSPRCRTRKGPASGVFTNPIGARGVRGKRATKRVAPAAVNVGGRRFCSCLPLFQTHVAAEIVVGGNVGRVALQARRAVVAGRQNPLQERALVGPGGLRLGTTIATQHGVVEPPMRRSAVDVYTVGLAVALQAIAKAP